jgi:FAD dependent oxidoreductase
MSNQYNTIIVGGGIAGLLTALRLAQAGQRVLVIEKDKIGTGATFSNHGMIHSGALYVRQHGHVVRSCQEAQEAFSVLVPSAEIATDDSLYIAAKRDIDEFIEKLDAYNFSYKVTSLHDAPEVNAKVLGEYQAILLKERVFSSRMMLEEMLSACLAIGVQFSLGSKVSKILRESGKVKGVIVGLEQTIVCDNVVIATGLGLTQLLKTIDSYYCQFLKSRLDMMVHLPRSTLKRGLIFADLDKPIIMPAKHDTALGSFYGGIQPPINGDRKFPVEFGKSQILIDMMNTYFDHTIVNTQDAVFYTCGKTDYTGNNTTEKGFIDPGFHIINHKEKDNTEGLYSVITGKMTLGFHASKAIADYILKVDNALIIKEEQRAIIPQDMLTVEPWASAEEI